MSVCQVVLTRDDAHQLDSVVAVLKQSGVIVDGIDAENGVIDCTGEAQLMRGLEHSKQFPYVRVVYTYCAEFPKDDPRDTNGR